MFKKLSLSPIVILQMVFFLVSGVAAFCFFRNPDRLLAENITKGNHALNEGQYTLAQRFFGEAIDAKDDSFAAYMGKLEADAKLSDGKAFTDTIFSLWELAKKPEALSFTEMETLIQATLVSTEYMNRETFCELLATGTGITKNMNLQERLLSEYLLLAKEQWEKRNFEGARNALEQFLTISPGSMDATNIARRVVREEVPELIKWQQYDKAEESLLWLEKNFGETSEQEWLEKIEEARLQDEEIQAMIEKFELVAQDYSSRKVSILMNSIVWNNTMEKVDGIVYSKSLCENGKPTGRGTGLYKVQDTVYVYYGDYKDGLRDGEGLWYYFSGNDKVVACHLHWEKDLPEGNSVLESTQRILYKSRGGKDFSEGMSYVIINIPVVHGIWNGLYEEHGEVRGETDYDSYTYNMSFTINGGYEIPMEDIPDVVVPYLNEGDRIVAITEVQREDPYWGEFTSAVWNYYLPVQMKIRGITVPFSTSAISTLQNPVRWMTEEK